jgi:hypothetical protein
MPSGPPPQIAAPGRRWAGLDGQNPGLWTVWTASPVGLPLKGRAAARPVGFLWPAAALSGSPALSGLFHEATAPVARLRALPVPAAPAAPGRLPVPLPAPRRAVGHA